MVGGNKECMGLYSGIGIVLTNSFWHFKNLLMLSQSALAWAAENKFFWKSSCALALFVPAYHREHTSRSADLADVLFLYWLRDSWVEEMEGDWRIWAVVPYLNFCGLSDLERVKIKNIENMRKIFIYTS